MASLALSPIHLPLAGYFALIGALLWLLSPGLLRKPNAVSLLYCALALAALGVTWTHMFLYFERSYLEASLRANVRLANYSTKQWLESTSLFNEAWTYVCATTLRWWWSEQLCAWTAGPFTVFLLAESKRRNIKRPWAYMLLGQVVAISFAQSLFCAAIALSPPVSKSSSSPHRASWILSVCTLTSFVTVSFTPSFVLTPPFLPNLLFMHLLLVVPLLPTFSSLKTGPIALSTLYSTLGLLALGLRAQTYYTLLSQAPLSLETLSTLPRQVYDTLLSHPAQSSISFDVVFASIAFVSFMTMETASRKGGLGGWVANVVAVPFVGIASVGSLFLADRERRLEEAVVKSKRS